MPRGGRFPFSSGVGRSSRRSSSRSRSPAPRTGSSAYHKAVNEAMGPYTTHYEILGIGTRSSAYHKAVNAVMAPHTTHHEALNLNPKRGERPPHALASIADTCAYVAKAFRDCIRSDKSDDGRCEYYLDILIECRRKNKPGGIFGYTD